VTFGQEIEQKYKSPFQFKPNLFVLKRSNSIWDIKGATTGLTRRMIYFNISNAANAALLKILLFFILIL
jgi:hypothetical protein